MLDLEFNDIGGKKTSVALGLFDGVHLGHRAVIKATAASGLLPAVFTFKSQTVTTKEGGALYTDEKKQSILESLGVRVFYSPDFSALCDRLPEDFFESVILGKLNAAAVCCGESFRFGKNAAGDVSLLKRLCKKHGIKLCVVPPVEYNGVTVSSTEIKRLLAAGKVDEANAMLGDRLSYTLRVVHGRELGRTLDFPTINQAPDKRLFLPRFGVYLSRVFVYGQSYRGVTNVGIKPTVGKNTPLIETNILGLDEDLYGEKVTVALVRFIRDEKRFNSIDELKRQVVGDIENAKKGSF